MNLEFATRKTEPNYSWPNYFYNFRAQCSEDLEEFPFPILAMKKQIQTCFLIW